MALLSLLMATLDEDIVDVIIGCKTSRQAWIALQELFSAVSRVSIMQLKTELQTIRKGSETIEKYLQHVKNARDQLLSVGVYVPDEDVFIVILNGLPDEYSTVRTVVEGRETPISLQDLRSQLLAAERRIEGSFSLLSTMSAMVARGDETRNGERYETSKSWDNKGGGGKTKDTKFNGHGVECSVCGKKGHTDPPASLAALTAQSTGSVTGVFHQTQGGGIMSNMSNGSSSSCFPGGFHPSSGASSSNSMAAPSNAHSNSEVWIGDSGATHHMTSELRNLTIAQPYASDNKITIGQGIQNSSVSRKE